MKKILFISDNDGVPWGGSEVLWSEAAKKLVKSNQISALVKQWETTPQPIMDLESHGVKVCFKNPKTKKRKSNFYSLVFNKFTKVSPKLHPLTEVGDWKQSDLVIISLCDSMGKAVIAYADVLIANKIPYVLLVQLATDLRMVPDRVLLKLKSVYENAKQVYFLSQDNADKTQLLMGCQLNHIAYVNNPFDYTMPYIPFTGDASCFSFACVASLKSFHKGQDLLIRVLGQEKWKLRRFCVDLYGEGVNRMQLERLIELYGLEDKVRLLGFEADIKAIWGTHMACILPSRMEGQSLAMLEAMACGRMVISTKVGDAERLIDHGNTGFLADYPSFEALDRTMEEAWNARERWLDMGTLSRQKLLKEIPVNPVDYFIEHLQSHLS